MIVFATVATMFWVSVCVGVAQAQSGRLPGELPIKFDQQLVDPSRVPTISEIEQMVSSPTPRSIAVVRLYSDENNHYAPAWSGDGRGIVFLRSDLDRGTRKAITHRIARGRESSGAPATRTLYSGMTSFEDLTSWSVGTRHLLVFDSTNEASGSHNVHQATLDLPAQKITDGSGVLDFPAIHADGEGSVVVFRRDRELYLASYRSDSLTPLSTNSIGEGEEAQPSSNGKFLAIVRRNEIGDEYRLVIRELNGVREKLLHVADGAIIRNPRFSPNGRIIAFHSRPITENRWSLWWVPMNGSRKAARVAEDVRVQEDFRHVGPTWNPNSTGLWYFVHSTAQAHYPLRYASLADGNKVTVEYPMKITTASEAAINPKSHRPVILFAGHTDKPRDIFALVLSHSP